MKYKFQIVKCGRAATPHPLMTGIKHLEAVKQGWDKTSQQVNCFDKLFKPQVTLNNDLTPQLYFMNAYECHELPSACIPNKVWSCITRCCTGTVITIGHDITSMRLNDAMHTTCCNNLINLQQYLLPSMWINHLNHARIVTSL